MSILTTHSFIYRLINLFYRVAFLIFRNALKLSLNCLNGWQIMSQYATNQRWMSYSCPLDFNNTIFFLRSPLVKSSAVIASSVHDLGVTLDCHLDMNTHVNQLCKSASFSLRRVGQVTRYLDHVTTEKLTHAMITSKLDQCNNLLYGLAEKEFSKIQRVQNSTARLVTRTKRQEHITPVLRKLHQFPAKKNRIRREEEKKKRIIYKILELF